MIGVDAALKFGAEVSSAAEEVGVKVPVRRWPFAWAALGVGVSDLKGSCKGRTTNLVESFLLHRQPFREVCSRDHY